MNAERLHAIAAALHKEMTTIQTVAKIEALCAALQQVVQQNAHPQFQQNLATNLQNVYSSLSECSSDGFSPAWKQQLSELGGTPYFGLSLKATIEEIFQRNQITPAVALTELRQLSQKLHGFQQALDQILSAFEQFRIGNEQLEPGECEIGMLIPRREVDNDLGEFTIELNKLKFVLDTFSELSTGKTEQLAIRTISSSDLTVYLKATTKFAACLAEAIKGIVSLYKVVINVRKHRSEMLEDGVPKERLKELGKYANEVMTEGIEKLTIEIVQNFGSKITDPHRKQELTNSTRISLTRIAKRIDHGFNIEVKIEPPAPSENEAANKSQDKELAKSVKIIQDASKQMQFINLQGQPILELTDGDDKLKSKEGAKS
jgi:hypothetical protein